jgi:hypothetical protein
MLCRVRSSVEDTRPTTVTLIYRIIFIIPPLLFSYVSTYATYRAYTLESEEVAFHNSVPLKGHV